MAYYQKRQCDVVIKANQHSPHQILHHIAIFVLTRTVVGVEVKVSFPQTVCAEEVLEQANGVRSLPCIDCFVNEIIDL